MSADLKVLLGPSDEGGCGMYRMYYPGEVAALTECDIDWDLGLVEKVVAQWEHRFTGHPGATKVMGVLPMDYDVLVMQRPMARHMAACIPYIQANGTAVVVEIDDDFWSIDPKNPAWDFFHPARKPHHNWEHLAECCRLADLVIVTTDALAEVVPTDKVAVIPNYVPWDYLSAEPVIAGGYDKIAGRQVVGWTGTPLNHPNDWQVMGNGVLQATRNTGSVFFSIGSKVTPTLLGYDDGEALFTDWVPLDKYLGVVAGLTVGLAPLETTRFNRCKSWLKGIEYAALGVPFVASPLPEYQRLHSLGAGELARKPQHWRSSIERLLKDETYRQERIESGRTMMADLTYEGNAWRWAEAWQQAVDNHRKAYRSYAPLILPGQTRSSRDAAASIERHLILP